MSLGNEYSKDNKGCESGGVGWPCIASFEIKSADCDKKDRLQKARGFCLEYHHKRDAGFNQSAVDLSHLSSGMCRDSVAAFFFFLKKGHSE